MSRRAPGSDPDLDDLENQSRWLAERYDAETAEIEPGSNLDAPILAAAHRAVLARPESLDVRPSKVQHTGKRWRVPFGIAATIVLTASIGVVLWQEQPDVFSNPNQLDAPRAPAASEPMGTSAPIVAPLNTSAVSQSGAVESAHSPSASSLALLAPTSITRSASARSTKKPDKRSPAEAQSLERVTVTGSNLRRADTETPSPVQVITLDERKAAASAMLQNTPKGSGHDFVTHTGHAFPFSEAEVSGQEKSLTSQLPASAIQASIPLALASALPPPAPAAPSADLPPAFFGSAPVALTSPAAPIAAISRGSVASMPERTTPSGGSEALLQALETAAAANDPQAARAVLETLHRVSPQSHLQERLRNRLIRLGIDPGPA